MRLRRLTLILALFMLACPALLNAQYAINLLGGGGPNGLSALSSSIGNPGGVAVDGAGNIYIADPLSSRVFKLAAGTVTVFAGNESGTGQGGYGGDGGPATSAVLSRPEGVAVDGAGNVFIADTDNSVIRCVVVIAGGCFNSSLPVGSITTVAGNTTLGAGYSGDGAAATSGQLNDPTGISFDGSGNLFIADTDNSVVREVVAATGNIQTVAGNATLGAGYSGDGAAATSAQLDLPNGVFVDAFGNIFVADTYNSVIRCVVGTAGGCLGSTLAVGDITTVAGVAYPYNFSCNFSGDGGLANAAQLCAPSGVSVDGSGDIFIADTLNSEVREVVASTGNIVQFAGIGETPGYTGDTGLATGAELNNPNGLSLDSSGNVFIADTENFVIREVSSGTINTVVGNHTAAFSGDGSVATNASLYAPGGVFVDATGNVFIADTSNCVIREILAASGNIQTVAGSGTLGCGYTDNVPALTAQLDLPFSVFVDGGGNIFIADTNNSVIRCVVASTGGCLGSTQPAGNMTTVAGTGVGGYSGDGGPAASAQLYNPSGVFVDGGGNVFIADATNSIIRCVVGTAGGCFGSTLGVGSITTVAGTPDKPCTDPATGCGDGAAATAAQLNFPAGIFVDSSGNLFIADTFDSKVREVVATTGNIQTVAGTGGTGYSGDGALAADAMLNDPYGLSVDSFGNIFIADTFNSVVREVVALTGNIQTAGGNGTFGYAGDGGAATSAELAHPLGVAVDALGNLFIADTENSRIRKLVSTVNVTSIPISATLPAGGSQQFAATVTGAGDTSVTWQVNGVTGGNTSVGTISTLGSYLAPAAVPAPATVTVSAVANANGVTAGSAPVTIVSSGTLSLTLSTSPTITEVYTGATQSFVANVTGTTNTAVNWLVNGVAGGSSATGTIAAGVYTAPAAVPTPATVVIGAVLQADSTISSSYPVLIVTAPAASQPGGQTISTGGSAMYAISLNANTGSPRQPITLGCLKTTLPANSTCTFSPATITPGASAVPFTLTISVPATSAAHEGKGRALIPAQLYMGLLPVVAIFLVGIGGRAKRQLPLLVLVASLGLMIGCGGGSSSTHPPTSQTYNVQVQGTTAAQPNPTTITTVSLTVQ